jgi:hypothetical protein
MYYTQYAKKLKELDNEEIIKNIRKSRSRPYRDVHGQYKIQVKTKKLKRTRTRFYIFSFFIGRRSSIFERLYPKKVKKSPLFSPKKISRKNLSPPERSKDRKGSSKHSAE